MHILAAILAAGFALSAIMALAWWVQRRTGNSGWIDAIWTFGTGFVAAGLALYPLTGESVPWRQALVAAMATGWALRLGWHIVGRTRLDHDDPRYAAIMKDWGADAPRRLFRFLQAQAAVALVLAASVAVAAHRPAADWDVVDLLAGSIFLGGWLIEAISDRQLRKFKQNAAPGSVCNLGLWSWSRHPNYFGEWLCWCAYPLLALRFDYPIGLAALSGPVLLYLTLVYASGIPPLEAHMRRSRGTVWSDYAARTSAFFPLPPRA